MNRAPFLNALPFLNAMKELRLVKRWKTERLRALAVSPNGTSIATGHAHPVARPDQVIVWDVATGVEVDRLPEYPYPIHAIVYSPDGRLLAHAGGGGSVRLWDVAASRPMAELQGPTDLIHALSFSPNGELLAAASRTNPTVYVWRVAKGLLTATLSGHMPFPSNCAFSPSGTTLAVGALEGIRLWSADTKHWTSTHVPYPPRWVDAVSFSPDGTKVAFSTRSEIATLALDGGKISPLSSIRVGGYKGCCFLPGGNLIVSCGFAIKRDGERAQVCVWDADRPGESSSTMTSWKCGLLAVSCSRDGQIVAIMDSQSAVSVWAVADGADVTSRKRRPRGK